MPKDQIKLKQIAIGQWEGNSGNATFSVIGLGEDGRVYKHINSKGGWEPLCMDVVGGRTYSVSPSDSNKDDTF